MTKRSRQIQQSPLTKRQRARWEREQTLNRRIIIAVGAVLAIAVLAAIGGVVWDRFIVPNRAVAQIGDEKITRREYRQLREIALVQQMTQAQSQLARYDQLMGQFSEEQQESLGQQMSQQRQQAQSQLQTVVDELRALEEAPVNYQFLDQLIERELIIRGADDQGASASEEEVYAELAKSFAPPPAPEPTATPVTATDSLTATDALTGSAPISPTVTPTLTPNEAQDTVATGINEYHTNLVTQLEQSYGIKLEFTSDQLLDFYKRQQRADMLRERIKEQLVSEAPKTMQVNARHILLQVTTAPTATKEAKDEAFAEAKQQADDLYEQLRSGADFAKLAQEHSDDPGSKDQGGELGWSSPDKYVAEFKDAILNQPVGEIGEPVRTQYGWHIIEVLEREKRPDEAKLDQERNESFQKWLDEQREKIGVQRFPEPTPVPTLPPPPATPTSESGAPENGAAEPEPTTPVTE